MYQVLNTEKDPNVIKMEEGTREKLHSRGGGGDLLAHQQDTGEGKKRVERSNDRGVGGDLSANKRKKEVPPKSFE